MKAKFYRQNDNSGEMYLHLHPETELEESLIETLFNDKESKQCYKTRNPIGINIYFEKNKKENKEDKQDEN